MDILIYLCEIKLIVSFYFMMKWVKRDQNLPNHLLEHKFQGVINVWFCRIQLMSECYSPFLCILQSILFFFFNIYIYYSYKLSLPLPVSEDDVKKHWNINKVIHISCLLTKLYTSMLFEVIFSFCFRIFRWLRLGEGKNAELKTSLKRDGIL